MGTPAAHRSAVVALAAWWSAGLPGGDRALVAGYRAVFVAGTGMLLLAALVAAVGFGRLRGQLPTPVGDQDTVDADLADQRVVVAAEAELGPHGPQLAGPQPGTGCGSRSATRTSRG